MKFGGGSVQEGHEDILPITGSSTEEQAVSEAMPLSGVRLLLLLAAVGVGRAEQSEAIPTWWTRQRGKVMRGLVESRPAAFKAAINAGLNMKTELLAGTCGCRRNWQQYWLSTLQSATAGNNWEIDKRKGNGTELLLEAVAGSEDSRSSRGHVEDLGDGVTDDVQSKVNHSQEMERLCANLMVDIVKKTETELFCAAYNSDRWFGVRGYGPEGGPKGLCRRSWWNPGWILFIDGEGVGGWGGG